MALPSSKPAGSDFPLIMIIIKGGHRRGGAGGYIHVRSLRRREARSSGRADQDGGDPRRRSPRRASSRAPQTPGLIQSLLRYRSTWLAPSFVRLVLRKRSPARWPTHSPFRHFRASISSFATPTVPRAGAGTTRCWPAVGLIRFRGLQVFGPLHGLPAPTRALRRPFHLLYCEYHSSKTDALRREAYFKTSAGKKTLHLMLREALAAEPAARGMARP
jgi:hypothetical protein